MDYATNLLKANTDNPHINAASSTTKFGIAAVVTVFALKRVPDDSLVPAAVAIANGIPLSLLLALGIAEQKKSLSRNGERIFVSIKTGILKLHRMGLFLAFNAGVSTASLGFAFHLNTSPRYNDSVWQRAGLLLGIFLSIPSALVVFNQVEGA